MANATSSFTEHPVLPALSIVVFNVSDIVGYFSSEKEYAVATADTAEEIFEHLDEEDLQKKLEEEKEVPYDHQLSTALSVIKGILTYQNKGIND